jgi:hypothetical protein
MKSAGALTSKGQGHHARASLGAMLLVLFASALADAQLGAEPAWKEDVVSGAASVPVARSAGDALIAEPPAPSRPLTATEPSVNNATTAGATTPPDLDGAQPGTVEIPPADSVDASQPLSSPALESQPTDENSDVARTRASSSRAKASFRLHSECNCAKRGAGSTPARRLTAY